MELKIGVIDTPRGPRFLWVEGQDINSSNPRLIEHTAVKLCAPTIGGVETIGVRRAGELIASGMVIADAKGTGNMFSDLGPFGDYRFWLYAENFEIGDEIIISPSKRLQPQMYFKRVYWAALTGLNYGSCEKWPLYELTDSSTPTVAPQ